MRVALIRGPLPLAVGFYKPMEGGTRKGFEVGQSVCQALGLVGLLRHAAGFCTFEDWVNFREVIEGSNAWRLRKPQAGRQCPK